MFDELFPAARADSLTQQLQRPVVDPGDPGFWKGTGSAVADALPHAALTASSAWAAILDAYGHAAAYRDAGTVALMHGQPVATAAQIRGDTLDQMGDSETARSFRESARRYSPDPAAVGLAGQIAHGLISGAGKMVAYSAAGPAGPALFGADVGINRAQELTDQGVDGGTAAQAGLVSGTAAAAMMKIPPALGATRVQSAAIGGAVAPVLSVAEVGGIQALLERADYDKIAAQYHPFDPLNLSIAALTGAAFGGVFHQGKAALRTEPRLTPEQHAAVLTMNEVRTRDGDTLTRPGDTNAASQAADAQALARQQMDAGEMVSVAHMIEPDPPTLDAARAMAFERMTSEVRAELIAEAGNRAEPGDIARLTQERADIAQRLEALRSESGFREEAKLQQEQGLSRKQAESAARKALQDRIADHEGQAARVEQLIEQNRRAAKAEQELALLDQGQFPERFLQALEGRAGEIVRGFEPRPIAEGIRNAFDGPTPTVERNVAGAPPAVGSATLPGIVEKVRDIVAQMVGKEDAAPKPESSTWARTPEQSRALEIASRNPEALVRQADGAEVSMARLLHDADAIEAGARNEVAAFAAAVNCAVRFPQ